jgi:hypothetical protein
MGKTIVITGASSGLGVEFARLFAKKGNTLILCARRIERLQKIKKELEKKTKAACEIVTADLSVEEECFRLYDGIKDRRIDIFINNAGFGECGSFCSTPLEKEMDMIHVNVCAVHIFTKKILQKFKKQGHGYLLNVASSAGLFPAGPFMASYYATKSYVVSLTKAAAEELKQEHSRVYAGALCPGPVDTEFNKMANVEFALPGISAERCVREAVAGMAKRKVIIVPTFRMRAATAAGKCLPDRVLLPIIAHQQKRKSNIPEKRNH